MKLEVSVYSKTLFRDIETFSKTQCGDFFLYFKLFLKCLLFIKKFSFSVGKNENVYIHVVVWYICLVISFYFVCRLIEAEGYCKNCVSLSKIFDAALAKLSAITFPSISK